MAVFHGHITIGETVSSLLGFSKMIQDEEHIFGTESSQSIRTWGFKQQELVGGLEHEWNIWIIGSIGKP